MYLRCYLVGKCVELYLTCKLLPVSYVYNLCTFVFYSCKCGCEKRQILHDIDDGEMIWFLILMCINSCTGMERFFMKRLIFIFCISVSLIVACSPKKEQQQNKSIKLLQTGSWRGVLKTQGIEIPFTFLVDENEGKYSIKLINAEEKIPLDEVIIDNDSIHIPLFIFDATIHAKIEGEHMNGYWVKNYAEDYVIPFEASFGNDHRFTLNNSIADVSFNGKWEVDFMIDGGIDKAIGIFKQQENKLTGTFLLPTGDYRFLDGVVDGDVMKLSCFDGTHAYLFEARMLKNGEIEGEFWSGKSWHQKWTAKRNEDFELPDPYALTFIKDGYDKFEIKFPNTSGDIIELTDSKYKDKVVVVQILGTWCPNCMDETSFYVDWFKKNKDRGVEIVGLAFEHKADTGYAIKRINTMKEKLGVEYDILIAGTTSAESQAKALPMLNSIMSFPTSIILDKEHKVRQIHTGFLGPGTGIYYEKFVEDFNLFMDKLVAE